MRIIDIPETTGIGCLEKIMRMDTQEFVAGVMAQQHVSRYITYDQRVAKAAQVRSEDYGDTEKAHRDALAEQIRSLVGEGVTYQHKRAHHGDYVTEMVFQGHRVTVRCSGAIAGSPRWWYVTWVGRTFDGKPTPCTSSTVDRWRAIRQILGKLGVTIKAASA